VAGNAQKPVPKLAPTGIELVELVDGEQPDLLVDVLGGATVSAEQVIDQSETVADVAIVHRGPGGPVPLRHRPDQVGFVVHRPAAPVVSFPLPEYCRSSSESVATVERKNRRISPHPDLCT
jgi:hypothetical protein